VNDPRLINDEDLHAYIDGALSEERALQVRQAMAEDAALAERAALFQADKAMFKSVYGPLADRPLPAEWIARAHRRRTRPRMNLALAGAIAATLLVVAGSPLVWQYAAVLKSGDVVDVALDAREGTAPKAELIATDGSPKVERYDTALRQAVASNVHVPDLSRMGYRLAGLHLYDKAAEILYRGPQNQLYTLYVRHSDGTARFDQFARRGVRVCIWQDDQITTVMAGDVSAAAMQRLATLSYTGLTS
jgi:anti-sigma factor RsiW